MASRIMHYAIGDLITKEISIKDYNRFICGNLAPDLSIHEDGSYGRAHFFGINEEKEIRGIDWSKFYDKYKNRILEDDFLLGYYVHLITDSYWLKNLHNKYVRKPSRKKSFEIRAKGHKDMVNYNRIIIDKFNLCNRLKLSDDMVIDEINREKLPQFLKDLNGDFLCEKEENVEFEIYPYNDVMVFMENALSISIREINALRENTTHGNPEDFYVETYKME